MPTTLARKIIATCSCLGLAVALLWLGEPGVVAEDGLKAPGSNSERRNEAARAEKTSNRALVAIVFDDHCKAACQPVRKLLGELSKEYDVDLVELDTSEAVYKETEKKARGLGISSFLYDSEDWVPIVGIFSARRKRIKEFRGRKRDEVYRAAIEKALLAN